MDFSGLLNYTISLAFTLFFSHKEIERISLIKEIVVGVQLPMHHHPSKGLDPKGKILHGRFNLEAMDENKCMNFLRVFGR